MNLNGFLHSTCSRARFKTIRAGPGELTTNTFRDVLNRSKDTTPLNVNSRGVYLTFVARSICLALFSVEFS